MKASYFFAIVCSLVVIIYISVPANAQNKGSNIATCRRGCGTSSTGQICASNGITYPNTCRYECAKTITPRLRIVKNGPCGSTSLSEYRRGQKGRSASG